MSRSISARIWQRFVNLLLIAGILLVLLPQATFAAADPPGPVLWLKFDETAGATTFADSGSGATNASCVGAACPTAGATGRLGQAAQFDGVNDRVTAARNAPGGSYSLAAWVRNDTNWTDWRTIFEFGDDSPWFGVAPGGQLALYSVAFGGSVPLGKWVHVAYSWDGATNRLYIDGKEVQSTTTAPTGGGQGLGIGLEGNGASPWNGFLDDLRFYERTLSAQEIEQLAKPEAIPVIVPPPPPPTVPDNTNTGDTRLFDISVSIYKTAPTGNDRTPYEDLFKLFADTVYETTNGAHALRTITIYDNGRFSDRANIKWIAFENQPRATVNGYGKGGTVYMGDAIFDQATLITDASKMPFFINTLIHEWGHYMYGIFDEYPTNAGDASPNPCSIMCAAGPEINFANLNFSTQKSTVAANRTNTPHFRSFQASAWDTVARTPNDDPQAERGKRLYWPDLAPKKPAAGQDPTVELPAQQAAARASLNIVWADANATSTKQRVFLVNISNDMGDNNKLNATKLALKNYVDRANQGDQLAVITFADVHAVVTPFTTLNSQGTRDAVKAQIDAIQAKVGVNDRNVDTAEQAAVAMLAQAANGGLIIDRSMFMIIDGGFTDNTEPHIFQKVPDQQGGIPLHIFNFASTNKPNDLYSNALELMRPFVGSYTVVSPAGLNIPGARAKAEEMADSNQLVSAFGDVDQEASPILDVDLGTAYNLSVDETTPFSTTIYVDDTLDELQVAVLFEGGSSGAELYLYDPSDQESDAPTCDFDGIDTLCFYTVSEPVTGTWTFEFYSLAGPLAVDYEATGYALDGFTYQATLSSLGGPYVSYPEEVVLQAELSQIDRIAGAGVSAWVENPDGTFSDLSLLDDGVAPDETADDGLYTGFMSYDQAGDYYATVVFDNIDGTAFFTQAGLADVTEVITSTVPDDFDRFASVEILIDDYAEDDHGADGSATDVPADNSDVPGRIDSAGDVDRFRLTASQPVSGDPKAQGLSVASVSATTQRHVLRLSRFTQGLNATVRVTTNAGTQEYQVGALAYDQYWALPLNLAPGEIVQVQVLHNNSLAAAGSYEISFGTPLAGEALIPLYLPSVLK